VIDLLGEGLRAVATRSGIAYPMVFAAGAVTGVGPCAAPRFVAVAALAGAARRPWGVVAMFGAGVAGAYVVLGFAAATLGTLWSASPAIYLALAVALAASAVATLLRGGPRAHASCAAPRSAAVPVRASFGGVFLLGASSAFVVAPCCTPVLAAIAGLTVASGRVADGAALLAAFGCGHALPVLLTGAIGARLAAALGRFSACGARATVAGGLMLALAVYYGVLA
jgi:cytochrome c biogenesis protein CcdA